MTKKQSNSLIKLPFDQYSRQKIASEMIDSIRKTGQTFSILDVGGYKGATSKFQSKDVVTVLDLFDVKEENYIKGDATDMEFKDGSYDFVVSFDVLEHIPLKLREKFLSECSRVSKVGVIVASPIKTKKNEDAENFLNNMYKKLHGKDHEWLIEHIENEIPEPGYTPDFLRSLELYTVRTGSNYTPFWVQMQSVIFAASKFDVYGSQIDELYETYNSLLTSDGHSVPEENYRMVTIGLKDKEAGAKVENLISANRRDLDVDEASFMLNKEVGKIFTEASDRLFMKVAELEDRLQEKTLELHKSIVASRELNDKYVAVLNSNSYKLSRKIAKSIKPFKK